MNTEGLSYREIAREYGTSVASVERSLARVEAAEPAPAEPEAGTEPEPELTIDELDNGLGDELPQDEEAFDLAAVPAAQVEQLDSMGVDLTDPESMAVMIALTEDPTDELNLYRISHLPRRPEWWAGRSPLGVPLDPRGSSDWAQLDADW